MATSKKWCIRHADPAIQYILQHELGLSPVLAKILANRGLTTVEEARLFLEGSLDDMYNPCLMAGMDQAVYRIKKALDSCEGILIYGDYDADGITATSLLVKVLIRLGGKVGYYVPHRMEEGYGLHMEPLRKAGQDGFKLVVTVDCGISALEEVLRNKGEGGPDVVITDHHEPSGEIPSAVAVINPKRSDCPYPFKELAGVGVALKLAQAVYDHITPKTDAWLEYMELACLGTVADIVPLTGENRIIVKYGLPALANTNSPGIKSLLGVSRIKPDVVNTKDVGFALAPRINAAGRLGDAGTAVDLLLTDDPLLAVELADNLDKGNRERQQIVRLVLAEAMGMLDAELSLSSGRVIVLASPGWHPGVLGIVASRLVGIYNKPVLMIALESGEGKGSGRSVPGFHLYNALSSCQGLLNRFGGHAQAAGFSISSEKVGMLSSELNKYAEQFAGEEVVPTMELDAMVSLQDINDCLIEEIQLLAPFGQCNPEPLLACREVSLVSCREVGKHGGHLKMILRESGTVLDGIAFNGASSLKEIAASSEVDVAFFPSSSLWEGRRSLQLEVKDIRPAGSDLGTLSAVEHLGALDSLHRMGPLAFLPEFVSAGLSRYKEASPNFMFPEQYMQLFAEVNSVQKDQTVTLPRMIDQECLCRAAKLYSLAAGKSGTLVLVNSPGQAVELTAFLNRNGLTAAFFHSGVLPGDFSVLAGDFNSGRITVLVCTYRLLSETFRVAPDRTVLFDVPYSPLEFERALEAGVENHVIFREGDFKTGLEYMEAMAPGRDFLAEMYTYIFRKKEAGYIDPDEVSGYMRSRGLARSGWHTVAFGLAVFSDLDLASCSWEGRCYRLQITPANEKKDLYHSATFKAGQEIKSFTENWWRNFYPQNGFA